MLTDEDQIAAPTPTLPGPGSSWPSPQLNPPDGYIAPRTTLAPVKNRMRPPAGLSPAARNNMPSLPTASLPNAVTPAPRIVLGPPPPASVTRPVSAPSSVLRRTEKSPVNTRSPSSEVCPATARLPPIETSPLMTVPVPKPVALTIVVGESAIPTSR